MAERYRCGVTQSFRASAFIPQSISYQTLTVIEIILINLSWLKLNSHMHQSGNFLQNLVQMEFMLPTILSRKMSPSGLFPTVRCAHRSLYVWHITNGFLLRRVSWGSLTPDTQQSYQLGQSSLHQRPSAHQDDSQTPRLYDAKFHFNGSTRRVSLLTVTILHIFDGQASDRYANPSLPYSIHLLLH